MIGRDGGMSTGQIAREACRWKVFQWVGHTLSTDARWAEPPLDWMEILEFVPGDVLPMLAHRVSTRSNTTVPEAVMAELRVVSRAAVMRGIMIRRAAAAVDASLAAAGIPFVWLKGAALRSQVYPRPELRPMEDLDVWVSPDAVPAAVAAVGTIGYGDDGWIKLAEEASGVPGARLVSESYSRVPLEIHGLPESLRELPDVSVQGLRDRAVHLDGSRGMALNPGDTLTHLSLHLSRHHRFALGLRPLLDISLCLSRWKGEIDWSTWCEEVHASGAAASVWLPMMLSREIFLAEVPGSVLSSLRPAAADHLLRLAKQQFEDTRQLPNALERLVGGRPEGADAIVGSRWRRAIVSLPNKVRHYTTRLRVGQIPLTGWRSVIRLARGRRQLADSLRESEPPLAVEVPDGGGSGVETERG